MVDNQELTTKQVPLTELLKGVPIDYRAVIDEGNYCTQHIPVGKYCHEASEQLTVTQQALDEAQANIAAQEISYKEWVVKHSEMYAENKKLQQALDRAVEALQKIVFDSTDIHACYHNNRRCLGCDKEDAEHGNTCIVMTAKAALASMEE